MGIFRFFKYIKNKYTDNLYKLKRTETFNDKKISLDNLLIDLNGVIHTSSQKIFKYGEYKERKSFINKFQKKIVPDNKKVYQDVCLEIDNLIMRTNPEKRVIIAIDGVAPLAKLNQQRKRRFKAILEKPDEQVFNSACITPSTLFMDELSKYIDIFIKNKINNDIRWKNLEIIFSNEKVPGEGEHILMNYIRKYGNDKETYCIVANDADLLLLTLVSYRPNFYVLREDTFDPEKSFYIVNIGKISNVLSDQLNWNIRYHKEINEDIKNNLYSKDKKDKYLKDFNRKDVISDFVLMCTYIGGDFSPHLPGIEIDEHGIEEMFDIHYTVCIENGHLTTYNREKGAIIDFKVLQKFMMRLGLKEKGLIENKLQSKDKYFADKILEENTKYDDNTGRYEVDMENYKKSYYENNFEEKDIEKICHKYIETLQWVLTYYTKGVPSWTHFYPYHYAPFLSDIAEYMKTYKQLEYGITKPVSPFLQLMSVLPPQSCSLLPYPLSLALTDKKSCLAPYFPDLSTIEIDVSGKKYEYEGVVKIPFVNHELFQEEYNKLVPQIDKYYNKLNIVGKNFVYRYNPMGSASGRNVLINTLDF